MRRLFLALFLSVLPLPFLTSTALCQNPQPRIAVYIPEFTVEKMQDQAWLESSFQRINHGVKIDKVYIETHRNGHLASDAALEKVKKFFLDHGVAVAGGIAYVADEPGEFRSYCYTNPHDRAMVKKIAELTARHFDEIILDDFFFNSTKEESDIVAKGTASWTEFRLKLMHDASSNLVLAPARAVNPKVKIIIKFPNWYEHFQGNGYDLAVEPKLFDGIYTGTETRDSLRNEQQLQEYQSFEQVRFFDNIAPGRNGGGWVDIFDVPSPDRYAEQLWDTAFAKAPEIVLFFWDGLLEKTTPGERTKWATLPTSLDYAKISGDASAPTNFADVAGAALEHARQITPQLGNPIGIASYKPLNSTSEEDFLQNYLGMTGLPVDLRPEFPSDDAPVLLTASAAADQKLVEKIEQHLRRGGNVIITTGLLHALQGKDIKQIAEIDVTSHKLLADSYTLRRRDRVEIAESSPILFPEVHYLTNDSWIDIHGYANGQVFPVLLRSGYGKGKLYTLAIPDNFTDLYRLPQPVLTAIKHTIAPKFPVQLDAPAKVALFPYDNGTMIVESFLGEAVTARLSLATSITELADLESGKKLEAKIEGVGENARSVFTLTVEPHSFVALKEVKAKK